MRIAYDTGSMEMLMIPAAIYLKVMPSDSELYMHARVLFVFGAVVMIAVVTSTILSYV
jgi:hypothetical protein